MVSSHGPGPVAYGNNIFMGILYAVDADLICWGYILRSHGIRHLKEFPVLIV
ncbi:hypothetical protein BDV28DRAFT_131840 [Aspergillus coremiiformis]|uniref:Uncharacterized protein n=1 Tax=Aspergillus coremiiformis TaxID=138285 RepID=A0A5N6ZDD2_9EURO|nr:hypothetical protein BDV28DRAFT_131840 [Aspergillus coremiiformis]